jgi:hypothetical protein
VRFTAWNDDGPIALSTDGRLLAQGMNDFVVYDIPKKRWRYSLGIRADARQGRRRPQPAFSPDASLLAISSPNYAVEVWDLRHRRQAMPAVYDTGALQVGFTAGGRRIFWCSEAGDISVANPEQGIKLATLQLVDEAAAMTVAADGQVELLGDRALLENRLTCMAGATEVALEACSAQLERPGLGLAILKGDDDWLVP